MWVISLTMFKFQTSQVLQNRDSAVNKLIREVNEITVCLSIYLSSKTEKFIRIYFSIRMKEGWKDMTKNFKKIEVSKLICPVPSWREQQFSFWLKIINEIGWFSRISRCIFASNNRTKIWSELTLGESIFENAIFLIPAIMRRDDLRTK